ncbi:MAG: SDR family oxidoreductase [Planctomycetota bacterium]|jgi:3-oxoacyl-[acyl-carrier protein] reductase
MTDHAMPSGGLSTAADSTPLAGRRALVCGSTQGIGSACATRFAELGARVTLVARDEAALRRVRDGLPAEHGQQHDTMRADFADWTQLRELVQAHVTQHGPVHVLLNNTGGPPAGPAHAATPEAYLDAFTKHLICNQVLVQAVLEGMKSEGYGRIINVISTSVITPIKGLGVSNTIRGAVANWARTLASELGPFGITVNNVLPGFTATARLASLFAGKAERQGLSVTEIEHQALATIPAGRLGQPEELAAVAGFLATPGAGYVNGVNLPVDGGRLAAQ